MLSEDTSPKIGRPLFFASIFSSALGGAIIGVFPHSGVASALSMLMVCSQSLALCLYLIFGDKGVPHGITLGVYGGFIWGIFRPLEPLFQGPAFQGGGLLAAGAGALTVVFITIWAALHAWLVGKILGIGRRA